MENAGVILGIISSAFLGIIMFLLNDIRRCMRDLDKNLNEFKAVVYRDYVTHEQLREHCKTIHQNPT